MFTAAKDLPMEKITSSVTADQFVPDDICTRAQIVIFIYRGVK